LSIGGGLPGVPNPHLIESALARPYAGYYPRIWQKAAALVESMARNHGFADGNKRTTLILLHTLLQRSGYTLEAVGCEDIQTAVENLILAVVDGTMTFDVLTFWLKQHIAKI